MVSLPDSLVGGELVGEEKGEGGWMKGSWVVLDVEAKAEWFSTTRELMEEGLVVGVDISEYFSFSFFSLVA